MYYVTECKHCHEMMLLVEKLEKELGVKVEQLEVWHDSANKKKFDEVNDIVKCTGVPFFFNSKTKKGICGAVDYEKLKAWASG